MRGMMSEFNLTARGPNTTHRSSAIYSRTIRHAGYTSSQRGSTNGKTDLRRVKWIKTVESMRNTRHQCGNGSLPSQRRLTTWCNSEPRGGGVLRQEEERCRKALEEPGKKPICQKSAFFSSLLILSRVL
jgi:hypothetical protein